MRSVQSQRSSVPLVMRSLSLSVSPLSRARARVHRSTPLSMDYIRLKHEVAELQKQVCDWQRKVQVKL